MKKIAQSLYSIFCRAVKWQRGEARTYLLFALATLLAPQLTLGSEMQSPLTWDDLARLETVGDVKPSPDGHWLAFVVKRPRIAAPNQMQREMLGNDRADVWLLPVTGGKPVNITNGSATGFGYWSPVWSPNSKQIAMLSTHLGSVNLTVWARGSGVLRQVIERDVGARASFSWVSNSQLVCTALPVGQKAESRIDLEINVAKVVESYWSEAVKGEAATVSVIESGNAANLQKHPQMDLLLVDLETGSRSISSAANFADVKTSPDGTHLAFLRQSNILQPDSAALTHSAERRLYTLEMANFDGKLLRTDSKFEADVIPGSLQWSMSSKSIAFARQPIDVPGAAPELVRCELDPWRCEKVLSGEMSGRDPQFGGWGYPPAILWAGKNLLVYVQSTSLTGTKDEVDRWDWWLVSPSGEVFNLTAPMKVTPTDLFLERGEESVVGLAQGKLWRLSLAERAATIIAAEREPEINSLVWPNPRGHWQVQQTTPITKLVVHSSERGGKQLLQIDLGSDRFAKVNSPSVGAKVAAFLPADGTTVFRTDDRTGTYLWLSRPTDQNSERILERNTFLGQIAEARSVKVEYRSLDGEELKGWLLLPSDYQKTKQYPLVVWVYAGVLLGDESPYEFWLNESDPFNLQLLAAHGYAVLIPSMPLAPAGEASDPYMELTKGVLPAVDKVIDLGIADPKRLGVMGHSYGGYSTYGLITQTDRFKAAISLAGISDLVSLYGSFIPQARYTLFPHEELYVPSRIEFGTFRMGSPPWKDLARYIRNSPLFYAERVKTPIMIIQGDLDNAPIQQGEEFFTALYRQGKRSEFVRYWGEGHVMDGTANVRDMWERIYAWFDQFLDITRDQRGVVLWDGNKVRSRNGAPPLKPKDFAAFHDSLRSGSSPNVESQR
jgi:dipeptidyl aminopeptidase/acylaminoacyl peptidase